MLAETKLLDMPVLDAVDFLGSNFLLPIAGLLLALMVGWRFAGRAIIADAGLSRGLGQVWLWFIRTIVPGAIVVIGVRSISTMCSEP